MQLAAESLQEADKWSTLSADIEETFKTQVGFLVRGCCIVLLLGFPGGTDGKESACQAGDLGSIPGLGRFPWRREWLPTPVFLPGESHGQRSLVGFSPWGCRVRHDLATEQQQQS